MGNGDPKFGFFMESYAGSGNHVLGWKWAFHFI
jgi:hypothetical protein